MRGRAARTEGKVIERKFSCARNRDDDEEEKHERGEFQRLAQREEAVLPVNEKHGAEKNRNLHDGSEPREESEYQQKPADEVRDHHIMHQKAGAEPGRRLAGSREEIDDVAG